MCLSCYLIFTYVYGFIFMFMFTFLYSCVCVYIFLFLFMFISVFHRLFPFCEYFTLYGRIIGAEASTAISPCVHVPLHGLSSSSRPLIAMIELSQSDVVDNVGWSPPSC